ncbi:hypothetical protein B0H63DRAFT_558879 [Podospora didyma]|uniref:Uncharacterized protein n=1 Tax=Podospora didyma TaxID=330526 RepID=A0AAE0U1E0_9PEZI|nr:hypothetical protein B0H63DRAFT_558879 [Podospora didyma]
MASIVITVLDANSLPIPDSSVPLNGIPAGKTGKDGFLSFSASFGGVFDFLQISHPQYVNEQVGFRDNISVGEWDNALLSRTVVAGRIQFAPSSQPVDLMNLGRFFWLLYPGKPSGNQYAVAVWSPNINHQGPLELLDMVMFFSPHTSGWPASKVLKDTTRMLQLFHTLEQPDPKSDPHTLWKRLFGESSVYEQYNIPQAREMQWKRWTAIHVDAPYIQTNSDQAHPPLGPGGAHHAALKVAFSHFAALSSVGKPRP